MPILLLVRHGENDYSRAHRLAGRLPGVHLNERGKRQAEALAAALAGIPLRAVYSSPLERTLETARPIAKAHNLQPVRLAGLIEADVGTWQGKYIRRLALTKAWRAIQQAPSRARHPAGEGILAVQERVASAMELICRRHGRRDVVACVTHADLIKLAVAHFIGLPLDRFQRLGCDTGSVTALYVGDLGATLLRLNLLPPFELGLGSRGRARPAS